MPDNQNEPMTLCRFWNRSSQVRLTVTSTNSRSMIEDCMTMKSSTRFTLTSSLITDQGGKIKMAKELSPKAWHRFVCNDFILFSLKLILFLILFHLFCTSNGGRPKVSPSDRLTLCLRGPLSFPLCIQKTAPHSTRPLKQLINRISKKNLKKKGHLSSLCIQ